jgi:UDP-N-acetylglucosamine acyltransferase
MAYAVVTRHVRLGDRVLVYPHAVVGGDPQFLKFDRAIESGVEVGHGSVIREYATVNRSIYPGKATVLGEGCFLMSGAHLAHDCAVGNQVVLANNALLAGHVSVGDFTFVGGGAAVHQFTRIGESAMVGGLSRITRDIAPYLLVAERDEVSGLNLVGLKRRGFYRQAIQELKAAFRAVFAPGNIRQLATAAISDPGFTTPEARRFLEFFTGGKRSFARPSRADVERGAE